MPEEPERSRHQGGWRRSPPTGTARTSTASTCRTTERSVFLRAALPDGEIDYRWAIAAMKDAGYNGYLAIEGASAGDQFHADQKSLAYAKAMWAEHARTRRLGRSRA